MYTISKRFDFAASHQLNDLPNGHKCARFHGHNYTVELVLTAPALNRYGFVEDYGDLKPFKQFIDSTLDHRHLNDIIATAPTAENLAKWLFDKARAWWDCVVAVRVSETPNTWAEYREGTGQTG